MAQIFETRAAGTEGYGYIPGQMQALDCMARAQVDGPIDLTDDAMSEDNFSDHGELRVPNMPQIQPRASAVSETFQQRSAAFGDDMSTRVTYDGTPLEVIMAFDATQNIATPMPRSHETAGLTAGACVESILEVFPDVDPQYVASLWDDQDFAISIQGQERLHAILGHIASEASYPRRRDNTKKGHGGIPAVLKLPVSGQLPLGYEHCAIYLLQKEFPDFDTKYIRGTLQSGTNRIEDAYNKLSKKKEDNLVTPPRKKRRTTPKQLNQEIAGDWIEFATNELERARASRTEKQADAAKAEAEKLNEEQAQRTGQMVECGCCFTDTPLNRTIVCTATSQFSIHGTFPEPLNPFTDTSSNRTIVYTAGSRSFTHGTLPDPPNRPHRFCYGCVTQLVDTEIGSRKCRPQCMDMSACDATFSESQLRLCLSEKTLAHLLRLQQQEEIKAAGLEGLEECPFCDFMMCCPPKDEDKEFRCGNPECSKVSCRLCSRETHLPKTCEEATADNKLDARHIVEEACSEALIRSCNKCKTKFIKLDGCNKMTCSKCGNLQCYLCSESIKSYEHFERKKTCPLYDNDTEALHQAEVKKAEAEAKARVSAVRKDVTMDDLSIDVSDRAKADEQTARRRGRLENDDYGELQRVLAPVAGVDVVGNMHEIEDPENLLRMIGARRPGYAAAEGRYGPGRVLGGHNHHGPAIGAQVNWRNISGGANPSPVNPFPQAPANNTMQAKSVPGQLTANIASPDTTIYGASPGGRYVAPAQAGFGYAPGAPGALPGLPAYNPPPYRGAFGDDPYMNHYAPPGVMFNMNFAVQPYPAPPRWVNTMAPYNNGLPYSPPPPTLDYNLPQQPHVPHADHVHQRPDYSGERNAHRTGSPQVQQHARQHDAAAYRGRDEVEDEFKATTHSDTRPAHDPVDAPRHPLNPTNHLRWPTHRRNLVRPDFDRLGHSTDHTLNYDEDQPHAAPAHTHYLNILPGVKAVAPTNAATPPTTDTNATTNAVFPRGPRVELPRTGVPVRPSPQLLAARAARAAGQDNVVIQLLENDDEVIVTEVRKRKRKAEVIELEDTDDEEL